MYRHEAIALLRHYQSGCGSDVPVLPWMIDAVLAADRKANENIDRIVSERVEQLRLSPATTIEQNPNQQTLIPLDKIAEGIPPSNYVPNPCFHSVVSNLDNRCIACGAKMKDTTDHPSGL